MDKNAERDLIDTIETVPAVQQAIIEALRQQLPTLRRLLKEAADDDKRRS